MNVIHYIGLDVHKKTISYCIKTADGRLVRAQRDRAQRDRRDVPLIQREPQATKMADSSEF